MGHVAENILHCCTCPDGETKYSHPCGCPSVQVSFQSTSKTVTLCGFEEFTGGPDNIEKSVPPKKYLRRVIKSYREDAAWTLAYFGTGPETITGTEECGEPPEERNTTSRPVSAGSAVYRDGYIIQDYEERSDYSPGVSCGSYTTTVIKNNSESEPNLNPPPDPGYDVFWGWSGGSSEYTLQLADPAGLSLVATSQITAARQWHLRTVTDFNSINTYVGIWDCESQDATFGPYTGTRDDIRTGSAVLSLPDSEEDAIARAAEVAGDSDSSIWELRTTEYTFSKRVSEYTIKIPGLVTGIEYQGCVVIERREAYSGTPPIGEDLEWHDVEPDIIAPFAPSPDEDGVTTVAEDVELPHVAGWEYRVAGVYVWPTYADCACPSEWEPSGV